MVPGGNPVIAEPGDSPTSPVITEDPVLVMVEPAITAYGAAAPKVGAVAAKAGEPPKASNVTKLSVATQMLQADARAGKGGRAAMRSTHFPEIHVGSGTVYRGVGTHTRHCSRERIKFNVNEVENRFLGVNVTVTRHFSEIFSYR